MRYCKYCNKRMLKSYRNQQLHKKCLKDWANLKGRMYMKLKYDKVKKHQELYVILPWGMGSTNSVNKSHNTLKDGTRGRYIYCGEYAPVIQRDLIDLMNKIAVKLIEDEKYALSNAEHQKLFGCIFKQGSRCHNRNNITGDSKNSLCRYKKDECPFLKHE